MQHKSKLLYTFCIAFLLSEIASATLTIQSYSSVYNFYSTTNGSVTTIYAGMTNLSSSCTASPCNSCDLITTAATSTTACNTQEIRPNSDTVSFTVKTDSSNLGTNPNFWIVASTTAGGAANVTLISTPTLVANTSTTYSVYWKDICSAVGASGCTKSFATTLTLGWAASGGAVMTESAQFGIKFRYVAQSPAYATNCKTAQAGAYQGFCYFTAFPGDKKAYIFPTANISNSYAVEDLSTTSSSGTVDASGMLYSKVHVCWKTDNSGGTAVNVTPTSSNCTDLKLDTSDSAHPSTSPMYVSGLVNDVPYYFNIASVDQAGIVTRFLNPADVAFSWNIILSVAAPQGSTQAAQPGPVYGLLDGQGCFIATAAYGSILAPEVETFRKFRNQYMLKSDFGKFLVKTYYKYSPTLADFISDHPTLKILARSILFPILILIKLAMWMGLAPLGFVAVMLLLWGLFVYLKKSKRGAA